MWTKMWIIEWRDRGRGQYDEAVQIAATPEEAAEVVQLMLQGETALDEETDEEAPAIDVLFEGEDPVPILRSLSERIELECETGMLTVRRTIQFKEQEPQPCVTVTEAEGRNNR